MKTPAKRQPTLANSSERQTDRALLSQRLFAPRMW
jgi:hypothetical protein